MKTLNSKFLVLFSVVTLALALGACNKRVSSIQNSESQSVPSNIKSAEQVKRAIVLAGSGLGWIIKDEGKGKLKGTIIVRSHQAVVSIPYSATEYSIIYESSTNLNYNPENNSIHRNYNSWVQNLNQRIQAQLVAM